LKRVLWAAEDVEVEEEKLVARSAECAPRSVTASNKFLVAQVYYRKAQF